MTGGRLIELGPVFPILPDDGRGVPSPDPPHAGSPSGRHEPPAAVHGRDSTGLWDPTQRPPPPLSARWKRVPYSKPSLAGAAAAWEGPRGTPEARMNHFDSLFGGGPRQDDQL